MGNMGIDTLKNNLSNLQRIFLWDVLIPNPIGGGDSNILQLRCQSTQIPNRGQGEIKIPYKQTAGIKFPGKLTYSQSWTCQFVEGEDKKIAEALYAWQQQIVHDIDGVGIGDDLIKTDVYLLLLDNKGGITRKIKLEGCYVQDIAPVELNYETEDGVKYNVTFSFDKWIEA